MWKRTYSFLKNYYIAERRDYYFKNLFCFEMLKSSENEKL